MPVFAEPYPTRVQHVARSMPRIRTLRVRQRQPHNGPQEDDGLPVRFPVHPDGLDAETGHPGVVGGQKEFRQVVILHGDHVDVVHHDDFGKGFEASVGGHDAAFGPCGGEIRWPQLSKVGGFCFIPMVDFGAHFIPIPP